MKAPIAAGVLALMAVPGFAQASEPSRWTLSGLAGVSTGQQTSPSFAWRASVLHWREPAAGIGIQMGRLRWVSSSGTMSHAEWGPPFEGLAKGGDELVDFSGELRFRRVGAESRGAPFIALGAGGYRQNIRSVGDGMHPGEGDVNVGWHVSFGGMGLHEIAPGAEFRFDQVFTSPGPSSFFTVSAALHLSP